MWVAGYVWEPGTGPTSTGRGWERRSAPAPSLEVPFPDAPGGGRASGSHVCSQCSHPPPETTLTGPRRPI